MRKRQWFILAFVISLATNIFLAGILLGKHFFHPPPPMGPFRPFPLERLIDHLSPDTQQKVRPLLQGEEVLARKHPGGPEFDQFRQMLHEQLTAEHVDEQRLRQTLADIDNKRSRFQEQMHETFIQVILALNKQEREELLEVMRRHTHERRGKFMR